MRFSIVAIIFSLLLSGCSQIPVTQDYDSRQSLKWFATVQWLPESMQTENGMATLQQQEPFVAKRIERAIRNHVIERDALFVSQNPEAYISYQYQVTENRTVEPSTTIHFGWGYRHIGIGSHIPMDHREVVTRQARWLIDIFDVAGKPIWRGESVRAVDGERTVEELEQEAQQVVDAILAQYPPN